MSNRMSDENGWLKYHSSCPIKMSFFTYKKMHATWKCQITRQMQFLKTYQMKNVGWKCQTTCVRKHVRSRCRTHDKWKHEVKRLSTFLKTYQMKLWREGIRKRFKWNCQIMPANYMSRRNLSVKGTRQRQNTREHISRHVKWKKLRICRNAKERLSHFFVKYIYGLLLESHLHSRGFEVQGNK